MNSHAIVVVVSIKADSVMASPIVPTRLTKSTAMVRILKILLSRFFSANAKQCQYLTVLMHGSGNAKQC